MNQDYTVIMCCYRRHQCLQEQYEAIKNQTIPPKEIWIWHNQSEIDNEKVLKYPDGVDVVVNSTRNFKFVGRWTLALLVRTPFLAMFDDDTIPGNKYIEHCFGCMQNMSGLYVGCGIISKPHKIRLGWVSANENIRRVDFGGHSWFLKTKWAPLFWREEPKNWGNGEDIHLSYMIQKYGSINTYVSKHPRDRKEIWSSIKGNRYGGSPQAHCLTHKKEHYKERNELINYYISQGWKVYPY